MSFLITNIAGSLTAGQVGQQQKTATEEDTATNYQNQVARELRARTQQLEEGVAAPEQDTEKHVGQAPEERRGRRRRQQHHEPEPDLPTLEPTEDIVEVHADLPEADQPDRPKRAKPHGQLDIVV